MIIQVKDGLKPIKIKSVSEMPQVGNFLYLPNKVKVVRVESNPLGVIVHVTDEL